MKINFKKVNGTDLPPNVSSGKYVYIAWNGKMSKVGITKNPKQRMTALGIQKIKGHELYFCFNGHYAQFSERYIHNKLYDFSFSGEWFLIKPEAILKILGCTKRMNYVPTKLLERCDLKRVDTVITHYEDK